jgi:twitching motility protein PilT
MVTQREIGTHTQSFKKALGATLRQDPNVILVGELRDLTTISFAVTAAETGHLVFGTVHTASVDTTVDRLINAFPGKQHEQVRAMLSESLRAVCCQFLLRAKDGASRCLAMETMVNSDAISSLIRKGKAYQIPSVMATSREEGMQLMDTDLMRLYKEDKVAIEDVYMKARSKREFEAFMPSARPPGPSAAAADANKPTSAGSATGS